MPQGHRRPHTSQLHTPGRYQRQVVLDPALRPGGEPFPHAGKQGCRDLRRAEDRPVLRRQPSAEHLTGPRRVDRLQLSAALLSAACSGSRPESAKVNSSTLPAAMPANQSNPGASTGATGSATAAASTRSGSTAAQASACGPPPPTPHTANRPTPASSATA